MWTLTATFKSAQGGNYANIAKYSRRLLEAAHDQASRGRSAKISSLNSRRARVLIRRMPEGYVKNMVLRGGSVHSFDAALLIAFRIRQ
jgi:hypothetical protein